MPDEIPELISLKDLANQLGVCRDTLRRWLPTKRLSIGKGVNAKLMYYKTEAINYIKSQVREG